MNCKFCNAEVDETHKFCPFCGKDLTAEEEPAAQETEEILEEVMQAPEAFAAPETEVSAETEEPAQTADDWQEWQEQPQKPKKKVWPLVLGIVAGVLALAALAAVLLTALGVQILPRANDINVKDSYTVEDDKAAKKADAVVATVNGRELTNTHLQIYYKMQVLDFLNYYGDYAEQLGIDYTKPLSEQKCYYDEKLSWEQYFLNMAIENWRNYQVLAILAEEAGYQMDEEWQTSLDQLPQDLEEQATEGEFESVDAMLQELIGPACTLDDYLDYVGLMYLGSAFYNSEYDRLTPTQEEAEAYFAENEATFQESGITKDSGLVSSVRHILVKIEGGVTDETGTTTYSEDEWNACYAEAEKILNEWKAGEATEDSFAALVATYTDDTGSATTGGLYEGVAHNSGYVEEFENWAADMSRQTGDTGIVKTEFGYHIMYFVSGEAEWLSTAKTKLLSERTTALVEDAKEAWPMKVNYRKIALSELEL